MLDWLRAAASHIHGLLSMRRLDREFKQEIESHLGMLADDLVRRGMAPDQALREARIRLGGFEQLREEHRDLRGLPFVNAFFRDARHGLRVLRKSPGFTTVAFLILTIGIGAAITVASILKSMVLDPIPYPDPGRLVQIWGGERESALARAPLSTPDYLDIREQATVFAESGTFTPRRYNLGGDRPEVIRGMACTPGLLRALGVQPTLGRWFSEAEGGPGASRVAILSHRWWSSRLSGDRSAVGRTLRLDGESFTVIGVMPAGFDVTSLTYSNQVTDLWTPLALDRGDERRNVLWLPVIGRLKPGATTQDARTELRTIVARVAKANPEANSGLRRTLWPASLSRDVAGLAAIRLSWMMGAVWIVLSLASQNVACMLLARGLRRQTEIAVRASMGAGRGHIIRMLLTENALLSAAAGAAGILLAVLSLRALEEVMPPGMAPLGGIRIDGWVALIAAGISGLTALMSGLTPALIAAKTDFLATLKEGGNSQSGSTATQRRLRRLVVGQVAASVVLVNGAILLSSNYRSLLERQRALDSERVLVAGIALNGENYATPAARLAFWKTFLERARAIPGVEAAAVGSKLPFEMRGSVDVLMEGEPFDSKTPRLFVERPTMSAGYFDAAGIPLVRGRYPVESDARGNPLNIVINRAMADWFWPEQNPLGKRLRGNCPNCPWWEVAGVVEDVRQRDDAPARPEMYFPFSENPEREAKLIVRARGDGRFLTAAIRREIAALDGDLALDNPRTMKEEFDSRTRTTRFLALVVNLFMAVALGLTAIGAYGTLSFHVARRTREFGVRMALGASRGAILLAVFRQAIPWFGTGAAVGLAFTILMSEILRAALDAINPLDANAAVSSVAVAIVPILLAAWLPARRAMCIDPIAALRSE